LCRFDFVLFFLRNPVISRRYCVNSFRSTGPAFLLIPVMRIVIFGLKRFRLVSRSGVHHYGPGGHPSHPQLPPEPERIQPLSTELTWLPTDRLVPPPERSADFRPPLPPAADSTAVSHNDEISPPVHFSTPVQLQEFPAGALQTATTHHPLHAPTQLLPSVFALPQQESLPD
jgi:hypothetical protein